MALVDPDRFTHAEQQAVRDVCARVLADLSPALQEALEALPGRLAHFESFVLYAARLQRPLELQVFGCETVKGERRRDWRGYLLEDRSLAIPLNAAWDALEAQVALLQSQWMGAYLESPDDPALLELASEPVYFPELEATMFEALGAALPWDSKTPAELHVGEIRCWRRSL